MRLYLAGPDVFLPDACAVGAAKQALCAAHGIEGVFPLDGEGPEDWRAIFARCEAMIRSCDALAANLAPFRGPGADPGTACEMGLMRALGRPVHGYSGDARDLAARIPGGESGRDADGLLVERFGLADNLMLEGVIAASGGHMVRLGCADPLRDVAPLAALLARLRP